MVSQLQNVSTVDLYYICQMVDNVTRSPGNYLRHIEDIFGDAASTNLVRKFPKWTNFHIFIEEVISSVIFERANSRMETVENGLWVNSLLDANEGFISDKSWDLINNHQGMIPDYLQMLAEEGIIDELTEGLSKQVFHVLFANRGTLRAFGNMISYYVSDTAFSFSPNEFTNNGHLKRAYVPKWATNAVFHRDKGRCVFCKTDLTNTVAQNNKLHFDHIVPLALGGTNCVTNLQLSCETCNLGKGARSASTSQEYEAWYNH